MAGSSRIRVVIRLAVLTAAAGIVVYLFVFSRHGYLRLKALERENGRLEDRIAQIETENDELRDEIERMDKSTVSWRVTKKSRVKINQRLRGRFSDKSAFFIETSKSL
jgi:cell division protein FtsB